MKQWIVKRCLGYLLLGGMVVSGLLGCSDKPVDYFSGYGEADYVRLSAPLSGTLRQLQLVRGGAAQAGNPAFVLEQDSERAAHDEAIARLQQAQATLADLQKGKRPDEMAALQAQVQQTQAALQLAQSDLQRQQKLVDTHFIAPSQLDKFQSAVLQNQALLQQTQAQLRVARLGARADEIKAAEQAVATAQAQLAQADWKVSQKSVAVPINAQVADIYYREGEWVAAGSPVISLLPAVNIKARFFVPQAALSRFQLGQPVSLQCDGCQPIDATVSYIAAQAEYTSPFIYSRESRATLVFMLEAKPIKPDGLTLHPGQPLEVHLPVGQVNPAVGSGSHQPEPGVAKPSGQDTTHD
ncbi:HlyD family secretion protein [Ampullimonas aquatilis]|uniref:HlyD family secretion protein n=1 Tax=Ampullimonas aquatilis TaxID=1341549 RepID=UPI003C74F390